MVLEDRDFKIDGGPVRPSPSFNQSPKLNEYTGLLTVSVIRDDKIFEVKLDKRIILDLN